MRTIVLLGGLWALLAAVPAVAQDGRGALDPLPPPGFGSLKQSDLSLPGAPRSIRWPDSPASAPPVWPW